VFLMKCLLHVLSIRSGDPEDLGQLAKVRRAHGKVTQLAGFSEVPETKPCTGQGRQGKGPSQG
jgi:hypothetical protein